MKLRCSWPMEEGKPGYLWLTIDDTQWTKSLLGRFPLLQVEENVYDLLDHEGKKRHAR